MRSTALIASLLVSAACGSAPPRAPIDLHVPVAPAPVAVAGAAQLAYELHVTNRGAIAIAIERVLVLDASGETIADLLGEALALRVGRATPAKAGDATAIAPGASAIVYLEHASARALRHRIEYRAIGAAGGVGAVDGARVDVSAVPVPVLGPPLRGGPWVAVHDPRWVRGHRRVFYTVGGRARIPGRYAIDWIKVDADGRTARGDEDVVSSWLGHGEAVLAVADGIVAATRDDMEESATIAGSPKPRVEDATGNYIALELGGGRYAFYEHLQPGSLRVRRGERVRRGQVIAALGFTGQATGPHLHFHVADANSPLGAEGAPYVFEQFELLGAYDQLEALGKAPWSPLDGAAARQRAAERPAPNAVVQFPIAE